MGRISIHKSRNFIVKFIWLLFLSSCLSQIDFPTDSLGNRLVVSGQVSTIADQNFIQLGRTADTDRLPFPVSGALINLFDEVGNAYSYREDEFNPGIYLIDNFSGLPSTRYFIRIITPEGETYESTPEVMPDDPGQLTSYYEFERDEYTDFEGTVSNQFFVKVYANSVLPSSENAYVKWNVDEVFLLSPTDFPDPFGYVPPPCFIAQSADPQRITLFNGEEVKANSLEGFLVSSRLVDWSFHERHYFTIYQSSLTKDAFEYWRKVNIVANQVGSIFDTPPAQINGNIRNVNQASEKILGYFQACNQTFSRMYLVKTDVPFPLLENTCTYDNREFEKYPKRCLDCLSLRNSSYRRPDWF